MILSKITDFLNAEIGSTLMGDVHHVSFADSRGGGARTVHYSRHIVDLLITSLRTAINDIRG